MSTKIEIGLCYQIGTGKLVGLPVSITQDGVPVSSFEYVFAAEDFSVAYDTINTQIGTLHLGCCNSLTISNGLFQEWYYGGVAQANPVALIGQVVQDVGQFAAY
jgi:hypothetical protein